MSDKSNLPTVLSRITEYLDSGGLWNPELADHAAVRDLILDARDEIDRLRDQLYLADQSARSSSAEAARLDRILAALREPSRTALDAATAAMEEANFYVMDLKTPPPTIRQQQDKVFVAGVRAAVAAAEQEVDRG